MKTSRVCAGLIATLALFAADKANAAGGDGTGGGTGAAGGNTAVLNTYSKVWVLGDNKGPDKIGKNTGAGTMDSGFAWDQVAFAADKTKVNLGTVYTRSDNEQNNDNSFMQGGFALATLTATGVAMGPEVALPKLDGERTFMRPQIGFLKNFVVLVGASEDNGDNDNPHPVLFLANKVTGQISGIPNNTRGANNLTKPTNLIQQAEDDGINVDNAGNQRGPHSMTCIDGNTCVIGMQYNNEAQEALSFTVADNGTVKVNWLTRYSDTAQHCRPQVAIAPGATTGFIAAVEANNQPAEIGVRVTEFNVANGKPVQSKIVVRSDPKNNKYVSSPNLSIMSDTQLAITYGTSAKSRDKGNGGNGHAGGKQIDLAALINKADLTVAGTPELGVGQYGRHGSSYVTSYGPTGAPALAVISGSSTGTGGGFVQVYPLKTDGTLGVKDPMKVYQASTFSDVANVQARGKRNPNDQARGFINGLGSVPNPGFTTDANAAKTSFMPEVKAFSFSTITGYSGQDAMNRGLKDSVWLSLVPSSWQDGLSTLPGKVTDNGIGPAARTDGAGTDPNGGGDDGVLGDDPTSPRRRASVDESGCGCRVGATTSSSSSGLFILAAAGIIVAIRRKQRKES